MHYVSPPPGLTRKEFVHQLREEARNPENIAPFVYALTVSQIIVVHYEREVLMKEERDVVQDLAQVLPGVDFLRNATLHELRMPSREFGGENARRQLGTGYELPYEGASLILERDREAILAYEAEYEESIRLYRVEQFKLASEDTSNRPEDGKDRVTVEDLLDGEGQQLEQSKRPSEGVPDRSEDDTDGAVGEDLAQGGGRRIEPSQLASEGASNRPEKGKSRATAEDLADEEGKQLEPSKPPSEGASHQSEDGTEGATTEDLAEGEGQIERSEGSQVDEKGEGCSSSGRKRGSEGADEEDQATHNAAGPSSASTSTPLKKRQRTNNPALDPITSDDRDKWINHVVESKEAADSHYDLLEEFLSANGRDHKWTMQQWNNYLKENTTYIARQVDQLKRYGPK